jgi:hypothetical protein
MVSQRFRIKTPTLAIVEVDGQKTTMYAQTGEIVTVVNGPLDGLRLVDVEWNGRAAMMFTIDLRERAALILETSATG